MEGGGRACEKPDDWQLVVFWDTICVEAQATHARTSADEESTMFKRPLSGRNRSGMLAHVRRPMMTAFREPARVVAVVVAAKYFKSPGSDHGKVPFMPMPPEGVAATMHEQGRDILGAGGENNVIDAAHRRIRKFRLAAVADTAVAAHHGQAVERARPTRRPHGWPGCENLSERCGCALAAASRSSWRQLRAGMPCCESEMAGEHRARASEDGSDCELNCVVAVCIGGCVSQRKAREKRSSLGVASVASSAAS
jgi:hypothetical protein